MNLPSVLEKDPEATLGAIKQLKKGEERVSRFSLRLVSVESASEIPRRGVSGIVVARVDDQLHFRLIDAFGKMAAHTEEHHDVSVDSENDRLLIERSAMD